MTTMPTVIRTMDYTDWSDETLFLWAVGLAEERGFDWTAIAPEDRGEWARHALTWEITKKGTAS